MKRKEWHYTIQFPALPPPKWRILKAVQAELGLPWAEMLPLMLAAVEWILDQHPGQIDRLYTSGARPSSDIDSTSETPQGKSTDTNARTPPNP